MKAAGKINGMNARCRSWLPVSRNLSPAKAALKSPHSRRFARIDDLLSARQRLDCGVFTAAFGRRRFMVAMRVQSWRSRLSIDPSFGVPRLRGPDRLKAELQTNAATIGSKLSMSVVNWSFGAKEMQTDAMPVLRRSVPTSEIDRLNCQS